ncbi:MAG: AraC family transcriptional regulator [Clostridiales bacterium]|nr:AraC family transcriptional regulator [Clostridiales bacterium]
MQYNGEYINQVFKKHYGYTIPEYSRMVCIRQMASLLITTSIPVDVICGQLGFVNRIHLYKLFTKEYACTPDEYRKNAGSLRGIKGKSLRRV